MPRDPPILHIHSAATYSVQPVTVNKELFNYIATGLAYYTTYCLNDKAATGKLLPLLRRVEKFGLSKIIT